MSHVPVFPVRVTSQAMLRIERDARPRFQEYLRSLAETDCELIVRKRKSQRSLDQNAYWWAVPVAILSEHCGYEPEQMHYLLLGAWKGYIDGGLGQVPRVASSSKLTTAEFTDLIEWVQRWAVTELDVQIPAPNEVAA